MAKSSFATALCEEIDGLLGDANKKLPFTILPVMFKKCQAYRRTMSKILNGTDLYKYIGL